MSITAEQVMSITTEQVFLTKSITSLPRAYLRSAKFSPHISRYSTSAERGRDATDALIRSRSAATHLTLLQGALCPRRDIQLQALATGRTQPSKQLVRLCQDLVLLRQHLWSMLETSKACQQLVKITHNKHLVSLRQHI